jgi:hypothetical protein
VKNQLLNSLLKLNTKFEERKEWVFKTFTEEYSMKSTSVTEKLEADIKLKGKALMGLK